MKDQSKGFDRVKVGGSLVTPAGLMHPGLATDRLAAEARRVQAMLDTAMPPPGMRAATVAPARGPQQLVPSFTVTAGGMRRIEGAHWQGLSPLASAVAQARLRHDARQSDAPFVPPYNPAQVAVAEDYAALVEWREGSAMKCASLEAGRGGSGSGMFIDTYRQRGLWLAELHGRIGDGVAMSIRRHMDRGNARRQITVRAALDMAVLGGMPVKTILTRFGWSPDMKAQKALRAAICGALDRMKGYSDPKPQNRGLTA